MLINLTKAWSHGHHASEPSRAGHGFGARTTIRQVDSQRHVRTYFKQHSTSVNSNRLWHYFRCGILLAGLGEGEQEHTPTRGVAHDIIGTIAGSSKD